MGSTAPKLTGWKCCREKCSAINTFSGIYHWSLDDPDLCSICSFRYCEQCTDLDEDGHTWTDDYTPRETMRKKSNGDLENHLFWNCCQCKSWNITADQDITDYKNGDFDEVQCSGEGCGWYFCPLCTLSTVYHSNEEGVEWFDPLYDGDENLKETQFFDGCNARSVAGGLEHSADNRRCWLLVDGEGYRSFHREEPWRGPRHMWH